jgi:hypothetical protein
MGIVDEAEMRRREAKVGVCGTEGWTRRKGSVCCGYVNEEGSVRVHEEGGG